ncbi:MAG TPA: M36 family metallopeptidase, partial [Solirubrobacteraceae bacterium]|nr:M36 family metallopeptidase [Solirubrobacteraceae bacterium]
ANFNTPADGTSPRLQVYVGATPLPFRLSEMEGDTIVHEYAHGLSRRLVGDGNMGSGVQTDGMGEGWSDFMATSIFDDPVIFEYSGGTDGTTSGFRRVRYDTSTQKYTDVCKPSCESHNDGEIWATALWAMRAKLRTKLGDGPGKSQAERLVVDGMKNTGGTPTFLTARDAIIAADQTNNAGANACLIWGVFAAREMGVSAATSSDQKSVTAATDGPAACTPTANAGGPYTTPEGTDKELDASASTPGGDGPLTYAWDLDDDGEYDDATGAKPSFENVGRDGSFPVAVKVTNANGFSATATSTVNVTNVAPAVGTITTDAPQDESSPVAISGTITDPGWQDPLGATIDFGDGSGPQALAGDEEHARPDGSLAYDVRHTYGDDGTFTIRVCAADDDVSDVCATQSAQVRNVSPTATISETETTAINGTPIVIAHAGEPVPFSGRSTDPGSDDLTLRWSWGDGNPLIDVSTSFLVNPPDADPDPSPQIKPRDVTDARSHAFGQACVYDVGFSALDDDGGSASDTIGVLIAGNVSAGRPTGYWAQQYRQRGGVEIDNATLTCYLRIVDLVSRISHEAKDASTFQKAQASLFDQAKSGSKRDQLDRDVLTAWLNFANGAVDWDELVDTNRDGVADTAFHAAMQEAESVRLAASSSGAQLDVQRAIVQSINDTI